MQRVIQMYRDTGKLESSSDCESEAIEELRFWRSNVGCMNTEGKAIERSAFFEVCEFSDASSSGYGGY